MGKFSEHYFCFESSFQNATQRCIHTVLLQPVYAAQYIMQVRITPAKISDVTRLSVEPLTCSPQPQQTPCIFNIASVARQHSKVSGFVLKVCFAFETCVNIH